MTVPNVIPGLPTVEIYSTVVKYIQCLQGIHKLVPKIKALYDNKKKGKQGDTNHARGG